MEETETTVASISEPLPMLGDRDTVTQRSVVGKLETPDSKLHPKA